MTQPRLAGAVQHMCFVNINHQPTVAAARDQGIGLVDSDDGASRGVIAPDRIASSLLAVPTATPGSDLLFAGGLDGMVYAYDPMTGDEVLRHDFGDGTVKDLAVFGDVGGHTIVAVLNSGLHLWDLASGGITQLSNPDELDSTRMFRVCTYQAGGKQWVTCAYTDGYIATWDVAADAVAFQLAHEGIIWSLIVTHDVETHLVDPVVVTGGADARMRAWDTSGPELALRETFVSDSTIRRLGSVTDGQITMLITAAASGAVALWRMGGSADKPIEVNRHKSESWALGCLTTENGVLIASGDMNGETRIKRLSTALLTPDSVRTVYSTQTTIWAVTHGVIPEGEYLACAGVDQTVNIVDPMGARNPLVLRRHSSTVRALAAGGDERNAHLISGGADHKVLDWDPVTGDLRSELPAGHEGEVWALATFHDDASGLTLVSGSADGTVRLVTLDEQPAAMRILAADCGEVNSVIPLREGDDTFIVVASSQGLRAVSVSTGDAQFLSFAAISVACGVTEAGRNLVVSARQDGVIELIDPTTGAVVNGFAKSYVSGQVRALETVEVSGTRFVLGGCDDGRVLVWHIDGTLIGTPVRGGRAGIRALEVINITPPNSPSGTKAQSALVSAGHDGMVRLWPITLDSPLRTGASVGRDVRPASILLQDQPTHDDHLFRDPLVETLYEALSSSDTKPPVVVGVHAPWGQGKSSLLRRLRNRVDPWTEKLEENTNSRPDREPSHQLMAEPQERKWLPGKTSGKVRTRLTRAWAWGQVGRSGDHNVPLAYQMKPLKQEGYSAISVWFNPWMYEHTEQIWAGLTREILIATTERLSKAERERLWFDLNLRRTDPNAMRRRIIASYIPRTLGGLVIGAFLLFLVTVAVVSMGIAAVNNPSVASLLGPTTLIMLTVLGTIAQLTTGSFKHVQGWVAPDELNSTAGPEHAWKGSRDPLTSTDRGYLYMLQHDVGEVVGLATKSGPLYIFIDDLDRCGPDIVADTIEAINLFLNKAFGQCIFVVALDPATVAAHLETEFRDISERAKDDPTSFGHLRHTGWRFMEKIIDLPIRLPRLPDVALERYLIRLLEKDQPVTPSEPEKTAASPGTRQASEPKPETAPDKPQPEVTDNGDDASVGVMFVPDTSRAGAVATIGELEALPEVRTALRSAVLSLPSRNPRQTKAFINLWRFYMVLEHRTGQLSPNLLAIERHSIEMARLVELMVRWPFVLDPLGELSVEGENDSPTNLELLLDACNEDDEKWAAAASGARMDADDRSVQALREVFKRALSNRDTFVAIARRYL